jgi:UTP:GlnB (protein PII) uridylyltransferase
MMAIVVEDPPSSVPFDPADVAMAEAFASSMPEAYRLRYGKQLMMEHARIVRARGDAPVHVATSPREPGTEPGAEWICIVTDDRPGLLSLLSAAVSAHSLDILAARIYCRARAAGDEEAVDFFAVRRQKGDTSALASSDLVAIGLSIEDLLRGETDVEWLERRASPTSRPASGPTTYVHFHEGEQADLLVVESTDRPGLLLTITLELHREGLTIIRSNVITLGNRARDEFEVLERGGARLSDQRRDEVVSRLQAALARTRGQEEGGGAG